MGPDHHLTITWPVLISWLALGGKQRQGGWQRWRPGKWESWSSRESLRTRREGLRNSGSKQGSSSFLTLELSWWWVVSTNNIRQRSPFSFSLHITTSLISLISDYNQIAWFSSLFFSGLYFFLLSSRVIVYSRNYICILYYKLIYIVFITTVHPNTPFLFSCTNAVLWQLRQTWSFHHWLCRKEMEKQKLVEWENSRKIELEQHRWDPLLSRALSSNIFSRQRETENVINLRAKKETIGAELENMVSFCTCVCFRRFHNSAFLEN